MLQKLCIRFMPPSIQLRKRGKKRTNRNTPLFHPESFNFSKTPTPPPGPGFRCSRKLARREKGPAVRFGWLECLATRSHLAPPLHQVTRFLLTAGSTDFKPEEIGFFPLCIRRCLRCGVGVGEGNSIGFSESSLMACRENDSFSRYLETGRLCVGGWVFSSLNTQTLSVDSPFATL